MNVLIIGGLGLIGHNVAEEFLSNGYNVSIFDSMTTYGEYEKELHDKKITYRIGQVCGDYFNDGAKIYHGDIVTAPDLLNKAFINEDPNIVINLANMPIAGVAVRQPHLAASTMVTGLITLLENAHFNCVDRFINISSSMVYGNFLTDPVTEDQVCNPQEIYGNLKMIGERLVRSYTKLHRLNHTIVRPSAVYGPTGNEASVITKFIRAARDCGDINIKGKDVALDFTYVTDIAHGIFLAATKEEGLNETFNITYGKKRTLVDVANHLQAWYPGVTINIEDPDPLYPQRGQLSIQKAKDLLGYEPQVELEEGLAKFAMHQQGFEL